MADNYFLFSLRNFLNFLSFSLVRNSLKLRLEVVTGAHYQWEGGENENKRIPETTLGSYSAVVGCTKSAGRVEQIDIAQCSLGGDVMSELSEK